MTDINIRTPAGIRRVIRQYAPWAGGKIEALSYCTAESSRSFVGKDGTSIVLFFAPDDDDNLYWLEIWPSFSAFGYTVDLSHKQYDQIEDLLLSHGPKRYLYRPVKFIRRRHHGKR